MDPRKTKDAVRILDREIGDDQELRSVVAEEHLNVRIARMISDGRKQAELTQKQLAELVGTTQSVIARLEDADYEGHSLSMLQRIAVALGQKLHIEFEVTRPESPTASL